MKNKFLSLLLLYLITSCAKPTNSDEFINNATGRYLHTSDQVIEIHFKEKVLLMNWKGIKDIEPMKFENDVFFVKEMNEKIMFKTNPENQQKYLVLVPKKDNAEIEYNYKKMKPGEFTPSEYLNKNDYDKALKGYLAIKEKDSLDVDINEREMNSLGYYHLNNNENEKAINILKINAALHPYSYNVYDSLGEAYLKNGDSLKALDNYKKALIYDSGNNRIKRTIEELEAN